MTSELIMLAVVVALPYLVFANAGWRAIFLLFIPVGFVQEPIRKSIEGQPVFVQLTAVAVFALALFAAIARFGRPTLSPLAGDSSATRKLLIGFVCLIGIQTLNSLIRYGSLMVPMIGMLSYLLPIPALWVAYQFVRQPEDIRRFLMIYVVCALLLTLGVIASYLGVSSELFGQVGGAKMVVYHELVGVVDLYCGYLRSPEVAAWHAAALACLSVVLAVSFKRPAMRVLCPFIVVYAFYTILLTGRRKALAIMVIFAGIYLIGLMNQKRRSSRRTVAAAIMVGLLVTLGSLTMSPESVAPNPYVERSQTAFGDAYDRFEKLGLTSIKWAYVAAGPIGLGTGAGAQGAGQVAGIALQGSAEGGLGRIMLELGPLGLILAVLCSVAVARQTRRCLSKANAHSAELFKLALGMLAFVAANVPIFIGAAQIFGDPFVLMILGTQLGFVLAVPRMISISRGRMARMQA